MAGMWQNEIKHRIARIARKIPGAIALKRKLFPSKIPEFTNSDEYWKARYAAGGNSGEGSYGELAAHKAQYLNTFVKKHGINTVFELGCGDGNQLSKLDFPHYTGVDISQHCIDACTKVAGHRGFDFMDPPTFDQKVADHGIELGLSLDVIYHLVEDEIYHDYMDRLFRASGRFVIAYASNFDEYDPEIAHVRHRKFTDDVAKKYPEWKLLDEEENPLSKDHKSLEYGSFAKFFVFARNA